MNPLYSELPSLPRARAAEIDKLLCVYRSIDRNKLVIDHFAELGFTKRAEEESGLTAGSFVSKARIWNVHP
jgi:hypothetical protein